MEKSNNKQEQPITHYPLPDIPYRQEKGYKSLMQRR
jgi:hypothetical protein